MLEEPLHSYEEAWLNKDSLFIPALLRLEIYESSLVPVEGNLARDPEVSQV